MSWNFQFSPKEMLLCQFTLKGKVSNPRPWNLLSTGFLEKENIHGTAPFSTNGQGLPFSELMKISPVDKARKSISLWELLHPLKPEEANHLFGREE
jgi:hypothetical protein